MKRFGRRSHARRSDERGAVLILAAFMMIGLLTLSAIVIDLGGARQDARHGQANADAAALAAARELPLNGADTGDADAARQEAADVIAANLGGTATTASCDTAAPANSECWLVGDATVTVATPYSTTATTLESYKLVYVQVCQPGTSFFSNAVGNAPPEVCRDAVARKSNASGGFNMGLVTLEPTGCNATLFQGSSTTTLSSNGAVMVNSECDPNALGGNGSNWTLNAAYIGVVGGAEIDPCNDPPVDPSDDCTDVAPTEGISHFEDPLNLPVPAQPADTTTCNAVKDPVTNFKVLEPGYYSSTCDTSFNNSGGVDGFIVRPGLYYFEDGFSMNGNIPFLCADVGIPLTYAAAELLDGLAGEDNDCDSDGFGTTGVTFYVEDGSIGLNGGAGVYLPPPLSGDYTGVSVFDNTPAGTNQSMNGNGDGHYIGTIYAPNTAWTFNGNGGDGLFVHGIVVVDTATIAGDFFFSIEVPLEAPIAPSEDDIGLVL